jgi:glycosyltransferase involved in cell wall biosynthesis
MEPQTSGTDDQGPMKIYFDMTRAFVERLRGPSTMAGMGRVTHTWGRLISQSENGAIISGLPASWIDKIISAEPAFEWMARGNLVKGPEHSASPVLQKMVARSGFRRDLLSRLKRGPAFKLSEGMARRGVSRIFFDRSFTGEKFIYHQPLSDVLPNRLPANCIPVVSIYDIMPFVFTDTYGPAARKAYLETLSSIKRHQAHVVVNSSDTKHSLICLFNLPGECIHVVPLGADVPVTLNAPSGNRREIPTARPYFLYVAGSGQRRKNVAGTIRGYQEFLEKTGATADLIVAGGGTDAFQAFANEKSLPNGRVHCLGQIDESFLEHLYRNAEIGLYLSLYEGFGLPVLECMQQGLPVVCGDKTSLPEVAGDAAVLVDPSNTNSISAGITRLWENESLRQDYIQRGKKRAEEFSWAASMGALMEVYSKITG